MNFNNAEPIAKDEAEGKLRKDCPGLLLEDERVRMAFKAIRDKFYFTSHRILVKDKQGITGKRTEYKSMPYHSVKAFSVETSGSFDADSELKVYAGGLDISVDFDKEKVDIFNIQKFLSFQVFGATTEEEMLSYEAPTPYKTETGSDGGKSGRLLDYLCGDSVRVDEATVQGQLNEVEALVPNECVNLAYKCGRDMVICTTKRILYIDTQGISGKRVEYLSMKYSSVKGYAVETAGSFLDRDATFKIFTNLSQAKRCLSNYMRKGQSDIMEVLWFFNNQFLGMDTMSKEDVVPLAAAGSETASSSLMTWMSDDCCQLDAAQVDQQFHSSPPLLQANEVCEVAFQGRRDLVLFTTKRILFVDKKGWSGKKMCYTTFPYSSVKVFQVTTAGSFDKDFELGFFTEVWFDPPKGENEPPTPGMSFVEFDINKNTTDILALYRYLASKVYKSNHSINPRLYPELAEQEEPMVHPPIKSPPQGAMNQLLNYFEQNMSHMDPQKTQDALSIGGDMPVLGHDEQVLMGFKCGRDSTIFTSHGILDVDVKGMTGSRREFRNIPYECIRHFSVESAGSFDRDSELNMILPTPWLSKVSRDFRSGNVDIVAVQNTLAAKILGATGGPRNEIDENKVVASPDPGAMSQLIAYISEKNLKIDPQPVEEKFKNEIPLLQSDEAVELAFKCGRDMFIITSKRVISIDVQGISGKKLEFISLPFKHINGFSVESAGTLDFTVKATLFTSKLVGGVTSDFGKKETDIFEINNCLANKILKHTAH